MAIKTNIAINKEYNLLTVFYDDESKIDELPQTTDSTAFELVLNNNKVGAWEFKSVNIKLEDNTIFIFKNTFPDEDQEHEEFQISSFTTGEQTTINNFIASV